MSQNLAPGAPTFVAEVSVETMPPRFRVLAVLSALMGFASISTDLYLPAMPTMAGDLHADAGSIELTVSGFLIGFSLGQLLWGPLGDRYGRRLPVAGGLLLFILGSAGCPMSGTSTEMICWRILQAVGACSGVVLSRAMDRDLYQGSRAAKMLSTLITVMAVAPLLGPIIGGQVLAFAGWRAIFWLLVIVGVATLAALFTIPETLPVDRTEKGLYPVGAAGLWMPARRSAAGRVHSRRRFLLRGRLRIYRWNAVRVHRLLPCRAAALWSVVRARDRRHNAGECLQREVRGSVREPRSASLRWARHSAASSSL